MIAERAGPVAWETLARQFVAGKAVLLSLWAEPPQVHVAYFRPGDQALRIVSIDAEAGRFPSIARFHPPALRLERAIYDLFGLRAEGTPDERPWLDHGSFLSAPMGGPARVTSPLYPFLPVDGEDLHEVPVGPVHAGIIEPGHFRFTASGEAVVRLEERFGYTHKGTQHLLRGASLLRGAQLAGRVSGDATVAYAFAFARAVEQATGTVPPERATWLRALMAELERIANHFGDIGAVCNDVAFSILHAYFGTLREQVLAASADCFGHRLMMDRIVPGGVTTDLPPEGAEKLRNLVGTCRAAMGPLVALYDDTASLQDRLARTGIVKKALAANYGSGGFIGRALD